MTERMSGERLKYLLDYMGNRDTLDLNVLDEIVAELDRARASEEELIFERNNLHKRVEELLEELAQKEGECRLIYERGMEAIREANKSAGDDDRIRRIVREEIETADFVFSFASAKWNADEEAPGHDE